MAPRRKRREHRARHAVEHAHPRPPQAPERKAEVRRRAAFEARMARVRRIRTVVGLAGFVPLGASLLCAGGDLPICAVPREAYLAIWAAIFGIFLGLTIRLWRERRQFERAGSAA